MALFEGRLSAIERHVAFFFKNFVKFKNSNVLTLKKRLPISKTWRLILKKLLVVILGQNCSRGIVKRQGTEA